MIAILGASGFVGGHLALRLASSGVPFRGLARHPERARGLPAGVELVKADILEAETLRPGFDGVDTVVHCAAITADRKEAYAGQYRRVHVEGTRNVVQVAQRSGVKRIVLMNGLGTRPGKPHSYMRTRWEMGEAVKASGLGWVALQPSVLFGDGAAFPAAFARLGRQLPVMPVLSGGTKLQPLWVEDLVTCLAMVGAENRWDGRAIDLGGPDQLTFRAMIDLIMTTAGIARPTVPLPLAIARMQARLFTLLPNPPLVPATLELFDFDNITQLDAVEARFGFRPRSIRDHFRDHGLDG